MIRFVGATDMQLDYLDILTLESGKEWEDIHIRGLDVSVRDILTLMASGMSEDQILADFPDLTRKDIRACLAFAADRERRATSLPSHLYFDQKTKRIKAKPPQEELLDRIRERVDASGRGVSTETILALRDDERLHEYR